MNYFYARDLQRLGRLPKLPTPLPVAPGEFNEEQVEDWKIALAIIALVHRPDGNRRSYLGVNRAAQRLMPDRGINIDFTEVVLMTWEVAGLAGLRDMISPGRAPTQRGRVYYPARNELLRMAATRVLSPPTAEVIVPGLTLKRQKSDPNAPIWIWAVAAEATYGKYAFYLLSQEQPDWEAVEFWCLWQTLKV